VNIAEGGATEEMPALPPGGTYANSCAALLVQASIVVTKTLRDVHEGGKLVNRIEDAKAERLLMEIERGK